MGVNARQLAVAGWAVPTIRNGYRLRTMSSAHPAKPYEVSTVPAVRAGSSFSSMEAT